jgi:nucleoside-diphosphate kinase
MKQWAVVLVKPHVNNDFPEMQDEIAKEAIQKYHELHLHVFLSIKVQFKEEQVKEFYAEHESKSFFPLLVEATTMGPTIAICVFGEDAISKIREAHGPTNPPDCRPDQLRKKYGRDERGRPYNAFHCTATPEEFDREYEIAFRKCKWVDT